ncbi:MAG: tyrosine-type recombinase/integrase [Desulfotomaculaceae bacterium]|nr:tyrosine-type recombinase/integrase [Desulfotomaculaceae bacterium]
MAGSGSLEKRGPNTWRLVVSCGMKGDKQLKKRKTVTTKNSCEKSSCRGCATIDKCRARREANRLLTEYALAIEKGQLVDSGRLTFADFVERWIRDYAEGNLAPKTLFRYKEILENRILPAMGHLKIEQIRPSHLMEFYANLSEEGIRLDGRPGKLSDSTILYHHRILSSILKDAVQWQVIVSNPCERVKPPKVTKKQAVCYDEEQAAAMLTALEEEELKYRALINLALFTGLRRGELMGLTWADVDFEGGTLEVRQASQYLPGQGIFTKSPKNESSERLMALPSFLVDLLRQYRKEQLQERLKVGDLWQDSDRLFVTWDGQPMHPDTVSGWFPKFLERHGLPHLPFHGIRHTAATMLINQNLPVKNISGRMGHSNISTTMNIYGHYLKSADKEAADRLEQVYQNMKGNGKKDIKKGQA